MPDLQAHDDPEAAAEAARVQRLYEASQTFLVRTPETGVNILRIVTIAGLLLLFFVAIPWGAMAGRIPDDRVNLLGQFLCYAIVALGIDLVWGYTGLLSLCQALFFALGGYAIGMHLSLPEGGGQYDYPQFMTFAYYGHGTELPWFWAPFRYFWFAVFAGVAVPGLVAGVFGFFILRNRVRGVYFAIITQALAAASWLLISRNEMLLGGTNGLTNFYRPMTSDRHWKVGLYLLTLGTLVAVYLFCRAIVKSRLGRVLIAVRDKETRLYFAGYKPYAFKVFAFSVGAMIAGLGGMLFAPQVGIINPQNMDVQASIFMVVMVALGGRGKLWGAVFGALLFTIVRSSLTSDLSNAWDLVVGLMAVVIVLVFRDGISGLWASMEREITAAQRAFAAAGHVLSISQIFSFAWYLRKAIVAVLPLVFLSIFLVVEILGLTPVILQKDPAKPDSIAPKYFLLVISLTILGLAYWGIQRLDKRMAKDPTPLGSSPTGAPLAAAASKGGA